MNTENRSDLEQCMDSALARLPQWQPPTDFPARLSAAAARQAVAAAQPAAEPAWVGVLEQLNRFMPLALGSAALAAILAWVVPWSQLAGGMELAWASVAVMGAAGIALGLRVLRAP
jgi:hypothetical protein